MRRRNQCNSPFFPIQSTSKIYFCSPSTFVTFGGHCNAYPLLTKQKKRCCYPFRAESHIPMGELHHAYSLAEQKKEPLTPSEILNPTLHTLGYTKSKIHNMHTKKMGLFFGSHCTLASFLSVEPICTSFVSLFRSPPCMNPSFQFKKRARVL